MNRPRTYRIENRRDLISGFDWCVLLTGPSVGGYGELKGGFGGKFFRRDHAIKAGEIWNETGLLPAFQTDERIENCRQSERHRVLGKVGVAA